MFPAFFMSYLKLHLTLNATHVSYPIYTILTGSKGEILKVVAYLHEF